MWDAQSGQELFKIAGHSGDVAAVAAESANLSVVERQLGNLPRAEQLAAEYVNREMSTPVVAYIAGFTAPEGKTMGHAGAIVSGGESTAEAKSEALREAGIRAATNPSEVAELVAGVP